MTNTMVARANYKASMAHIHLSDMHVEKCRVLPTRERMLDLMPPGAVAAEVGVAFGDFTSEIVTRTSPRKLHLVDAWEGERYESGLAKIKSRFVDQIAAGRIEINQGHSVPTLSKFPDGHFDLVYIDTNHSYETTKKELDPPRLKCKSGGRISGHDFTSGNAVTPVPYGVIEACNEFYVKNNLYYEYAPLEGHGHLSFCLKGMYL